MVNISQLASVGLTQTDTCLLLDLPTPESVDLSGSPKEIAAAIDNLFSLWTRVVVDGADIPIKNHEYVCPHGHRENIEGEALRGRLILSITGYFDHIIRKYLASKASRKNAPYPKALVISRASQFASSSQDAALDSGMNAFRQASFLYLLTLIPLYFTSLLGNTRMLAAQFEPLSHENLSALIECSFSIVEKHERIAARRLVHGAAEFARHVYGESPKWNDEHVGPFSAIRLRELAPLAKRDELVLKRYGAKNVERVFEKQLALIMQSFGFYIVPTRTGQKTIDLVCISSNPEERLTFLVEAKTTKAPYSLPRKDSRALSEYVGDVRRSLATLPPLSFVLVVGHLSSKTLPQKLKRLEAETSIPMRFIEARQLAELRGQIPGPLPLKMFLSEVLTSDAILTNDFVKQVVASYELEQQAHRKFVEAMLTARGAIVQKQQWVSDVAHGG